MGFVRDCGWQCTSLFLLSGLDGGVGAFRKLASVRTPTLRVELLSWGARLTVLVRAYVLARSPRSHEADWRAQGTMPIMLGASGSTLRCRRPQCLCKDLCPWALAPVACATTYAQTCSGPTLRRRQALKRRQHKRVQGRMSQHDSVCPVYAVSRLPGVCRLV